jgi:hypothetical protein
MDTGVRPNIELMRSGVAVHAKLIKGPRQKRRERRNKRQLPWRRDPAGTLLKATVSKSAATRVLVREQAP